ncbi:MAG: ATP-binding protein [Nitrospirae bacterium]|nr:ATP-binding protein [Nitrospirota bacterium]
MKVFKRRVYQTLLSRLQEPRRFIQILSGPRQTGKTILSRQAMEDLAISTHYASADEPTLRDRAWIEQQWNIGRLQAREDRKRKGALIVLDEIQKIPGWSGLIKHLWDQDTANKVSLKVVLLGSAPWLIQRGLTESLAGRFELIHVTHWSFSEMQKAFGWNIDQFLFYGGYPGGVDLIKDPERWSRYIVDSLVETTISRDILLLTRVDKPALFRRLFQLGCDYSGQVLSYQKMIGQMQDAGNTTTLAHYLELLSGAGMLTGLSKFAGQRVRQRGSSPKLLVLDTALLTASSSYTLVQARKESAFWGRVVESAVGAHLVNSAMGTKVEVFYWRERGKEVDFILRLGKTVVAIEVKSGLKKESHPGMESFLHLFKPAKALLVGEQGIPLEEFLSAPAAHWASL